MGQPPTELPDDIAAALNQAPDAKSRFTALPPSHQAEYLTWITQAKRAITRTRRIASMIERLRGRG